MFRRKASVLLATLGVMAAAFVAATPAAVAAPATTDTATCTGHAGCYSGWKTAYYYDTGLQMTFTSNIAVTWYPDNQRRVYVSGSVQDVNHVLPPEGMDEIRMYYKLPSESTYHLYHIESPGPVYGTWYPQLVPVPNPALGYDWIARDCWAGTCTNTPGIYN